MSLSLQGHRQVMATWLFMLIFYGWRSVGVSQGTSYRCPLFKSDLCHDFNRWPRGKLPLPSQLQHLGGADNKFVTFQDSFKENIEKAHRKHLYTYKALHICLFLHETKITSNTVISTGSVFCFVGGGGERGEICRTIARKKYQSEVKQVKLFPTQKGRGRENLVRFLHNGLL